MIGMTRERALEIIELNKTVPQPMALLIQAIRVVGALKAPG